METTRFSKLIFAVTARLRRPVAMVWLAGVLCGPIAIWMAIDHGALAQQGTSPHLDPEHGVKRVIGPYTPIGGCAQCHDQHALETGESPYPNALFAENSNALCYTPGGAGPCHQATPVNYPATESSRIPEGFPEAGYFEHNSGGSKIRGADSRNRWPGQLAYENPNTWDGVHYFSPHRNDTDMPRRDASGVGSCLNCHNPHGSDNPFDMLVAEYRGIGGFDQPGYPSQYGLCFSCHSGFGEPGMETSSRFIADYYDSSVNADETAGHQINMDSDIALSWPSHIRRGDKLPCYDCHGVHGSRGYNGQGPNAFLISDERPGWANLTNTRTDPEQNRRFCLGCHIASDGMPGSQVVEGIIMNTLSDEESHGTTDPRGCFDCHGNDYSSPGSYNVHHPGDREVAREKKRAHEEPR